jgi:O-antigen ligase
MNQLAPRNSSVVGLVLTWVLMPLLMFFAAQGSYFFQHAGGNDEISAKGGDLVDNASAEDTTFGRVETALIFGAIVVLVASRGKEVAAACIQNPALAALPVLAIISTAWSQFPAVSFHYSLLLLGSMLFAFYLAKRFRPDQQDSLFWIYGWISVVLSCILSAVSPTFGIDHREGVHAWQGIYGHKNACAIVTIFLMLVAFFRHSQGRRSAVQRTAYVLLSLFLVFMTESRSGWVVAAAMIAFMASYKLITRFTVRERALLIPSTVAVFVMVVGIAVAFLPTILAALGKDPTLTGRTGIWSAVLISIRKHPLLGYGYRGFWHGLEGESSTVISAVGWMVPHAHNGFLETWLDLGLLGLTLLLTTLFQAFRHAMVCLRSGKPQIVVGWYLSIVILTIMFNLDERTFLFPTALTWMMYVIACVGLRDQARLLASEQTAHLQVEELAVTV